MIPKHLAPFFSKSYAQTALFVTFQILYVDMRFVIPINYSLGKFLYLIT